MAQWALQSNQFGRGGLEPTTSALNVPDSLLTRVRPTLPTNKLAETARKRGVAEKDVQRMYKDVPAKALMGIRVNFEFRFGSGAGIRTLNLAVNSRLLYR